MSPLTVQLGEYGIELILSYADYFRYSEDLYTASSWHLNLLTQDDHISTTTLQSPIPLHQFFPPYNLGFAVLCSHISANSILSAFCFSATFQTFCSSAEYVFSALFSIYFPSPPFLKSHKLKNCWLECWLFLNHHDGKNIIIYESSFNFYK